MTTIKKRVDALRALMAARDMDAYIIPTSDPHQSEYVPDYYQSRVFMTGFTGSAGTAVISRHDCGLWTDSRYFIQAAQQLKNTPYQLYKLGTDDLTIEDYLKEKVPEFGKIGFDGRCLSVAAYKKLAHSMGNRMLVTDADFVSSIWEDRPALPGRQPFYYPEKYSGQSVEEKLKVLRYMMKERGVDCCFIGGLEDVCYLFNIRGWDIEDTPVVLSYALVSQEEAKLFLDQDKQNEEISKPLNEAGVAIFDYPAIEEEIARLEPQTVLYLDPQRTNIKLYQSIPSSVTMVEGINLTSLMKAIKNETEIENTKAAYIKDGVALVKFFNWLETGAKVARVGSLTEQTAVERLHSYRAEDPSFLEDSFAAIIGYGPNGAIVHYDPMESDEPAAIQAEGLVLVDSGGHYWEGTTDITRTCALGPTTEEEKEDYTLVLKAHIAGMSAKIKKGTTGAYLHDIVRHPLLQHGKDYGHGTGHGIGQLLSVHEGPQAFSSYDGGVEIVPGMVTSMEPGLYVEGKHGIRIESATLCVEGEETAFGRFYELEPLTWVPIDTRPVKISLMTDEELDWLNCYNQGCYDRLSQYLEGDDLVYLKVRCQPVHR